ncbi:hypothetical protein ACFL6W_06360 [Thermodesulfobacteriota bacterium]
MESKETLINRIEKNIIDFISLFKRNKNIFFIVLVILILIASYMVVVYVRPAINKNQPKKESTQLTSGKLDERLNYNKLAKQIDEMSKKNEKRFVKIEELILQSAKMVEKGIVESDRKSILASKKSLPPIKIFSEEPYSKFACFDYVVFSVVNETEDEILFSNENSAPVVNLSFVYDKKDGRITYDPLTIQFNENNKMASYENYLGLLLFNMAQAKNARLVFWNLIEDREFIRTKPIIPTNLVYDHESIKPLITFLEKMVRIERFAGGKIPFKLPPTELVYKDVNYIWEVLRGNPIQIGFKFEITLNNSNEKEWFLKHFFKTRIKNVRYRMEGKSHIIEIYNVPIELGMWTMDFPDSIINPSLDDLKKDESNNPVTIIIETKDHSKEIVLFYNTHYSAYLLSDPPLPMFPKHPLMSQ